MKPVGRRTWAALTLALAGVLLVPTVGALGADGGVRVDSLKFDGQRVHFTVAVPEAPAGTRLDPTLTTVSVDGQAGQVDARGDASVATVVLVFDASGSMRGAPMDQARAAAHTFVGVLPGQVQVALVTFSDQAAVRVAPTTDRAAVNAAINAIQAGGETALFDAVGLATQVAATDRTLVVLSDGGDTASDQDLPSAISQIGASGTRVESIAFATSEFDMSPIAALASAGKGQVRTADDGQGLVDAFVRAATGLTSRLDVSVDVPPGIGGPVPMVITVSDGQSRWTSTTSLQLPALPGPTASPVAASIESPLATRLIQAPPSWILWVLTVLAFVAALLLAVVMLPRPLSDRVRRARALEVYSVAGRRARNAPDVPTVNQVVQGVLDVSERVVQARGTAAGTALRLDRAGMALRPHEWLIVRAGVMLGAAAVMVVVTGWLLRGLLIGLLLGWLVTHLYLHWRQRRRTRAFSDSLPETLQLVASSIQTGFSLPQALDAAQQHGQQPISGELGRALAAARLGVDLEDELDRVGVRMDSDDWRWAVMAIRIQRHVGGNLAEVLMTTVHTLRERAATRRQVRALSAEGRLSAYILIALPVGLFAFLFLLRREYIQALWTTPLGAVMSAFAVLLMVVGWFWMSRVVKVEA